MDCCNVFVWNVRGLNSSARQSVLCSLIRDNHISIVCTQESKVTAVTPQLILDSCGSRFRNFLSVPSDGASGGLIIAWDDDLVEIAVVQLHRHFLIASCTSRLNGATWIICNVYGPTTGIAEKLPFLSDLKAALVNLHLPIALMGDFNLIAEAADKSNLNLNRGLMLAFRGFMNDLGLKDLYLHGRRYTWSNEQLNSTRCRLDRLLYNSEWHDLYPKAMLQAITSASSDHSPLVLTLDADFHSSRRFRFETFWARQPDFLAQVQQAWDAAPTHQNAFINLHLKLQHTGHHLKRWGSRLVNDMKLRVAIIYKLIYRFDLAGDHRQLSDEEHQFRRFLKVKCLGIAAMERCMWRQRSRFLRLKEGDCNSKKFHIKASARRRKSFIPLVATGTSTTVDQARKVQEFWSHFNALFGSYKPRAQSINLECLDFPTADLLDLDRAISKEEVRAVIQELHPEKAPGPDGFTGLFYRLAWNTIRPEVMAVMQLLENANQQGLSLLNNALLVLLPKIQGAVQPG